MQRGLLASLSAWITWDKQCWTGWPIISLADTVSGPLLSLSLVFHHCVWTVSTPVCFSPWLSTPILSSNMTAPPLCRKVKLSWNEGRTWHNSLPWDADYGHHKVHQFCLCCCVDLIYKTQVKCFLGRNGSSYCVPQTQLGPERHGYCPVLLFYFVKVTQTAWDILFLPTMLPKCIQNTE